MAQLLDEKHIAIRLAKLHGWKRDGGAIVKEWQFRDFAEAMQFINRIARIAEQHNHHPELYNVYNRVRLRFSTHDAGGLTEKDFQIAEAIDALKAGA